MASIISVRHFTENIGSVTVTGVLFTEKPLEDSFAQGTASVLNIVEASFIVRLDGNPVTMSFPVLGEKLVIVFNLPMAELVGRMESAEKSHAGGRSQASIKAVLCYSVCRLSQWTTLFSAQSTANQKSEDTVVALALDGRSVRYGKQFFRLVTLLFLTLSGRRYFVIICRSQSRESSCRPAQNSC
jgi:hypothetical protein